MWSVSSDRGLLNVFDKDLGVHQGRIPAAGATGFVYELGHALLADVNVDAGDLHEISQSFVITPGSRLLTAQVRIVTPQELPIGQVWTFSVWLNGKRMFARVLRQAKRVLSLDDMRISLRDANAPPATNQILFRLELV